MCYCACVGVYISNVFISREKKMKREEENLKERREKEDSKKVGAHNFLSSTQKTPRKRHKHNKEERRERKFRF